MTNLEIEQLRQAQEATLLSTCTIKTVSVTQDELGDSDESYSETSNIPCGFKQEVGDKGTFRFAHNTFINPNDLISIDGEEYQVSEVLTSLTCKKALGERCQR